ncbi:MAG: ATP-binding cassette domain-containing protein [Verrucomicrobia bacterium]|nr:ATP-binding cassette domain-containing protein [Verrucomicrobiota bacterium]
MLGPSGSGKTTLLRLIAGLDRPSAGRVFIEGRDCTEEPPEARDVGLVFQGGALFPHLDVFENLALPLRLRRTPRAELERRVEEMSEWLGLGRLQRRRPGNCREANVSAWRWAARWSGARRSCCWTNRWRRWTVRCDANSGGTCSDCTGNCG